MEIFLTLIAQVSDSGVCWVPVDKYVVRAKPAEEFIPLPNELYTVRKLVLGDKFEDKSVPTISYGKFHEIMISASATSLVKKVPGCKCKKGKCTKNNLKYFNSIGA